MPRDSHSQGSISQQKAGGEAAEEDRENEPKGRGILCENFLKHENEWARRPLTRV